MAGGEAVMAALRCGCGRRFYPMGVEPGGLAKCPGCGNWMRVPAIASAADEPSVYRRRTPGARWRRPERAQLGVKECLLYPFRDAPGVLLMVLFPPFLWFMSVPVFDVMTLFRPGPRGNFNPMALILLPAATPLVLSFAAVLGYVIMFLSAVLVSAAVGEVEHPRWPEWDRWLIMEGIGRWVWAGVVGVVVGGYPVMVYWTYCGDIDPFDQVVLAELIAVAAGYAQMVLIAALLHDSLTAANPAVVLRAIGSIGWSYAWPCLATGFALMLVGTAGYFVLFRAPNLTTAAIGLWAFWVLALYVGLVVMRMLGLVYYTHAARLGWFRSRPRWEIAGRVGKIYVNS